MSRRRKSKDALLVGCIYTAASAMVIALVAMIGYILITWVAECNMGVPNHGPERSA